MPVDGCGADAGSGNEGRSFSAAAVFTLPRHGVESQVRRVGLLVQASLTEQTEGDCSGTEIWGQGGTRRPDRVKHSEHQAGGAAPWP